MQKILDKWKALPFRKQVTSIVVFFLLAYSFYGSIEKVFVTPFINHLQQDFRHDL